MDDEPEKTMRPKRVAGDYEVGYGKPPASWQFGPGRPGNRNGRPHFARTIEEAVHRSIHRKIAGKRGKRFKPRTWAELIGEQIVMGAANGNHDMIGELKAYLPPPLTKEELEDEKERPGLVMRLVAGIFELAEWRKELALYQIIARELVSMLRPKDKTPSRNVEKYALRWRDYSPLSRDMLSALELSLGPWAAEERSSMTDEENNQ